MKLIQKRRYAIFFITLVTLVNIFQAKAFKACLVVPTNAAVNYKTVWGTPWDFLSERYISYGEVSRLTNQQVWVWKNSIYARKGYYFKNEVLRRYFLRYSWYVPRYKSIPAYAFSKIEKNNIAILKEFE